MTSKLFLALSMLLALAIPVYAQEGIVPAVEPALLSIDSEDLWISQGADGGYHLYIRKKPEIASVLLTETTRDPLLREPNYAYRANTWNPVNGNEIRFIDGLPLTQTGGWPLIDSTAEYIPEIGAEVFHIYIPYIVYYGYPETRHGEVYVGNGTYINIRAFSLPYADYRGSFKDNPFILEITQAPLEGPPEANFMKDTEDAFERITGATGGTLYHSIGPEDIVDKIKAIIQEQAGKEPKISSLDLVICLDTTASMKNDISAIRSLLIAQTKDLSLEFETFRIGMVLYRDYEDAYITKVIPFTNDLALFQKSLDSIRAVGGRDIPEAVDEALYDAALQFPWSAVENLVILIGDAPPHPIPKGDITEEMAITAAQNRGIKINA
ncbi:MAG: VWA domain-containing protein, partial [Spirochaetaceae bacterium]|nr:VWA domain-containing protein [Spirochaetaceae bacterium]